MNEIDIFDMDIELPEIVQESMDFAFSKVKAEAEHMKGNEKMDNIESAKVVTYKNKRVANKAKHSIAAAACICVVALAGMSAAAAVYHNWSRGMTGKLQSTEVQQIELFNQGVATVFDDQTDIDEYAVTDNGVTVRLVQTIVDKHFAYLSFKIEGYELEEGKEPCFDVVDVYNAADKDRGLNMSGSFYNGLVCGPDGRAVYDDGRSLEYNEDGSIREYYKDENGSLEFVMILHSADIDESMLGQKVHIQFEKIGTVRKAEFFDDKEGVWGFDIPLSGKDAGKHIDVNSKIGYGDMVLRSVDLSPVSINVICDMNNVEVKMKDDYLGVPELAGIQLKDGTILEYVLDGGQNGFTDETYKEYYELSTFNRVIDVDNVAALLFKDNSESYIVPIN